MAGWDILTFVTGMVCLQWQTFSDFGGREPCESWGACHVTLTLNNFDQHCVDRRQSSRKEKVNKTCIRRERKLGSGGLPPRKMFEATPSRLSENAFLQRRI